jgi:hypothetical protein
MVGQSRLLNIRLTSNCSVVSWGCCHVLNSLLTPEWILPATIMPRMMQQWHTGHHVKRDYSREELGDFRSISGKDTDSTLGKDLQNFLHHVNRAPKDGGGVHLDVILVGLSPHYVLLSNAYPLQFLWQWVVISNLPKKIAFRNSSIVQEDWRRSAAAAAAPNIWTGICVTTCLIPEFILGGVGP